MHRRLPYLLIFLALVGCANQTPPVASSEAASKTAAKAGESTEVHYVISAKYAPFYQYGPAQRTGPDLGLVYGDSLMLVKRESGFSRVRLDDGRDGYVANDLMKEAPKVSFRLNGLSGNGIGGSSRSERDAQRAFVPPTFIDDTPLPVADPAPLIQFR